MDYKGAIPLSRFRAKRDERYLRRCRTLSDVLQARQEMQTGTGGQYALGVLVTSVVVQGSVASAPRAGRYNFSDRGSVDRLGVG